MRTKNKITYCGLIALAMGLGALPALGGEKAGNGGGFWVCYDNPTKIRWAKLVDFYELENDVFQLHLGTTTGTEPFEAAREVLRTRIKPIDLALYSLLSEELDTVEKKKVITRSKLVRIDDGLWRVEPYETLECANGKIEYVQIANYTAHGEVLVRESILEDTAVPFQAKVGLYVHEAVYALLRRAPYNDTNSVRAREINGYIFSTLTNDELKTKLIQHLYNQINQPVAIEPKVISTGETLYFVKGTKQLAVAGALVSDSYELKLPAGTLVELLGDFQLKSLQASDYRDSWIKAYGTKLPLRGYSFILFDDSGKVSNFVIEASLIELGGKPRKLTTASQFYFKNGSPYCLAQGSIEPILLGVAGTQQTTPVKFPSLDCIHLDVKGFVTEADFVALRVKGDTGAETTIKGHFKIVDGKARVPGKGTTFDAVYKGYKVHAYDLLLFCKAKGFPAEYPFTERSDAIKSHEKMFWDFENDRPKRVEIQPGSWNPYSEKITCHEEKFLPVLD